MMKHVWICLSLLLLAGLIALGVAWRRSSAVPRQLAQARAVLGTPASEEVLSRLARAHPENSEILFLEARHARLAGDSDRALATLQRAAGLGCPKEEIDRERLLATAQKDFTQAEGLLQSRLDLAPGDADLRLALAMGYLRLRYHEKAENLLTPFLERHPDNGAALALRGRIRLVVGRLDLAQPDLEKALRLGPDQYYAPEARVSLAACLLDLGKFKPAYDLFRTCQAESPDNPTVLLGLGRSARLLAGTDPAYWKEAEDAFQRLLALRPGQATALLELAYVHEQRNEFPQALALLEEAEQSQPERYEIYFRMAKVLRALGQDDRAEVYQKRYDAEDKKRFRQRDRKGSESLSDS